MVDDDVLRRKGRVTPDTAKRVSMYGVEIALLRVSYLSVFVVGHRQGLEYFLKRLWVR